MSVYKYLLPERIDVVRDKRIRFSQIKALNDPFEMKPYYERLASDDTLTTIFIADEEIQDKGFNIGYDIIEDVFESFKNFLPEEMHGEIEKVKNLIPERKEFLKQAKAEHPKLIENELLPLHLQQMPEIRNKVSDSFNYTLGILCLSEIPDNLLMWTHYAKNQEGFVIEFDEKCRFFNTPEFDGNTFGTLQKVKYCKERPNIEMLSNLNLEDVAYCKSEYWNYEEEWRIIKNLSNETLLINKKNEPLKDLQKQPIHLFPFPVECMKGIILGSRMKEEDKQNMLKLLEADENKNIKIFQAVEDEREYKLNIMPINYSL